MSEEEGKGKDQGKGRGKGKGKGRGVLPVATLEQPLVSSRLV